MRRIVGFVVLSVAFYLIGADLAGRLFAMTSAMFASTGAGVASIVIGWTAVVAVRWLAGRPRRIAPGRPIRDWKAVAHTKAASARLVVFEPTGAIVEVVGESAHQGTLELIARGRTIDGAAQPDHIAVLVREPTNPYDRNAVLVILSDVGRDPVSGPVGHLSRTDAVAYRPVIDRLANVGLLAGCRAAITGGWQRPGERRGSFGVRLHLDAPQECLRYLDNHAETQRLEAVST